jgi:LPXTG-site transpeptidase (sortase) family protein
MEQANQKFKNTKIGIVVVLATLVIALFFYLTKDWHTRKHEQKRVLSAAQQAKQEFPVRLLIPAINVDANIQQVGVNPKGEMDVPSNTVDVAWFDLGPRPGDKGNAVIAGHFDGENGKTGVFADLQKLKTGDKLYVLDNKGATVSFVVRQKTIYKPGYVYDVFSSSDSAHLNLVTCDGLWNGTQQSYSKRLVVYADIIN